MNHEEFCSAQMAGLTRLADILRQSEVNFVIVPPGADMGYIEMLPVTTGTTLPTPGGLHAIYDPHTKTYDIWKWGRKRPVMKERNLSEDDAAEMLTSAYFVAKAQYIRKRHPEISMAEIVKILRRGYQRTEQKPDRASH